MTAGKGDTQRPFDADKFNAHFDQIFGVKCKRCGKTGLLPGSVHTCSPQVKKEENVPDK